MRAGPRSQRRCLVTPADPAAIAGIAAALLGTPVDAVEPVHSAGRNSRVHRIRRGGDSFALKSYPSDGRDRLQIEEGALRLMARYGIACIPRVVATDTAHGYALLEWIDGDPVGDISSSD